ncbi:methyltransferase [Bradyrhizobium sp. SSBR45G]|uniref:tRNA1(Val) (adenine(37)-N6)-methyltransferase n=1 Tax=unclassified Bradyrhizobium TaxID=2631580 RepID=UPI002342B939|nr:MULTISPECIES: methyltransferase [unclassified Bradyrhizobium]GLH80591.1 methyltransferase [Bradyrhizobium sp. SSBR45G]GLH85797.1 methyltransferase [Bradyrhizobium sp. SSBR45R]
MSDAIAISEDAVLGGRLRLRQPTSGHRAGHDAILLAAATAARPGDRAVDLGAGVGTAGLALARRVEGLALVLVEREPQLAELARDNAHANALQADVIMLDVAAEAAAFAAAGLGPDSVDVVLMNPPFHDAARHRASPDAARASAHLATSTTLELWTHAARRMLRSGGVLTMIWRADGLGEVLAALARGFGSLALQPVHGQAGKPAIRILVRAVKGGRAPTQILPAVVLNEAAGMPSKDVVRVLEGQGALALASVSTPVLGAP